MISKNKKSSERPAGKRKAKASKTKPATVQERKSVTASLGDISRGEGIAIWRQIAEDIASEIQSGSFPAGSRLPTETQLAENYKVNRHTLRRALAELSRRGLVEAAPRRGTFVRDARIEYPIRQSTSFSKNIIAAGRDPGGKLLSAHETTAPPEKAAWLGIAEKAKVIEIEMIRYANELPICWTTFWLPADRFQKLPRAIERFGNITKALSFLGVKDYHRKMTRITARQATARERNILQLERGATALLVESLNVDNDGEPIQSSMTVFAANIVQLTIDQE